MMQKRRVERRRRSDVRRGGAAAGERGGGAANPGGGRRARLSARGDRLPSSLLISAFNTLDNWLARAHRLGTVAAVRSGY